MNKKSLIGTSVAMVLLFFQTAAQATDSVETRYHCTQAVNYEINCSYGGEVVANSCTVGNNNSTLYCSVLTINCRDKSDTSVQGVWQNGGIDSSTNTPSWLCAQQ